MISRALLTLPFSHRSEGLTESSSSFDIINFSWERCVEFPEARSTWIRMQ